MEAQQLYDTPSNTVLGALKTMSEFAAASAAAGAQTDSSGYYAAAASSSSRVLGFERTHMNALFAKTIIVAFLFQFPLFYTFWWLFPSLTKNRRGLAWVLTFCSACVLLTTTSIEFGYLRTPLWSYLGWEQTGPDAAIANIFSYWIPNFYAWALQLGTESGTRVVQGRMTWEYLLSSVESAKTLLLSDDRMRVEVLAGQYLRWLMSLPIFSLAPLKTPQLYSSTAPYYLGGGGRLMLSLENFPRETVWSSVLCGYFVAYCAADLVIGWMHYREHVDPMSGYLHHVIYTWLIWRLGSHGQLSIFLIAGGIFEVSTIFLASGHMFPRLREDFWFPTTFILIRLFFAAFMTHEVYFSFPSPPLGTWVYIAAFFLHIYWIVKYYKGLSRRRLKAQTELQEKKQQRREQEQQDKEQDGEKSIADEMSSAAGGVAAAAGGSTTATSSSVGNGTFQLRAKKTKNRS
ncbi:hypothetical protein BGX33_006501 [Mortierella sp. NVP41]|nr:hypothetical protein BGX33_006501 [Mortierella sp. NVP41]